MDAIRRFRSVIFRSVCVLFLVMLATAAVSAQIPQGSAELSGAALSASLFDALLNAGLTPEKQYLSGIQPEDFPYNVIVTPGTAGAFYREGEEGENISGSPFSPSRLTTLAFVISQADVASHFDIWLEFISGLQPDALSVLTQFVFTANDTSILPRREQVGMPAGTLQYIEAFENTEALCVLVLSPAAAGPFVIPGSGSLNAPLWLNSQLPFPVFGTLMSLYRFNLTAPDARLSVLREREIASALLIWNPNNSDETASLLGGLRQFITGFMFGTENDLNYSIIPTALQDIIIGESAFIRLYILVATLCLVYLCVLLVRTKQRYMLLLLLLFFAITTMLFVYTDFAGIILRLVLVLIAFSLFNTLLTAFFHIDHAIYGVLYVLQAALNVLIFGTFDSELLLLFTVEFIIAAALYRALRQLAFCGIAALLSVICYVFILQRILVYADYRQINLFLHGGILSNAVLVCISLPFLLLWVRSQTQIVVFIKQKYLKTSHTLVLGAALTALIAIGFFAASMPLSRGFIFRRSLPDEIEPQIINDHSGSNIFLESLVDIYFDQEIVTITARAELPIIRCNISVQPLKENAVIYSAETTLLVPETGTFDFRLNEYPPNPFTVSYVAERNLGARVMAEFFLSDENGAIIRAETEIEIH